VILPGKHIRPDRSLVVLGGEVLAVLAKPRTVTDVWGRVRAARARRADASPLTYDLFVLALTFLYSISAVRLDGGLLCKERRR
jgi:hypothetical protein